MNVNPYAANEATNKYNKVPPIAVKQLLKNHLPIGYPFPPLTRLCSIPSG